MPAAPLLECPRCGPTETPPAASGEAAALRCDSCGGPLRPRPSEGTDPPAPPRAEPSLSSSSIERRLLEDALNAPPDTEILGFPGSRPASAPTPKAPPASAPPASTPTPSDAGPLAPAPPPRSAGERKPGDSGTGRTVVRKSERLVPVTTTGGLATDAEAPPAASSPPAPAPGRGTSARLLASSLNSDETAVPTEPVATLRFEKVIPVPGAARGPGDESPEEGGAPSPDVALRRAPAPRRARLPLLVVGAALLGLACALVAGLLLVGRDRPIERALHEARGQASPEGALISLEREGISLLPRADVQAIRARAQLLRGNTDEARRAIEQGETDVAATPEDRASLLATKGLLALATGDLRAAAAALEQATLSPTHLYEKDASVLGALAQALLELKDAKGALAYAKRALDVAPRDPRARRVVARALLADGQAKEALAQLEGTESDRELLALRSALRVRLGDPDGALRDLEPARGPGPLGAQVALARADALLLARGAAGGIGQARAEAESARGLGADPGESARSLARVALVQGRVEEADKLLSEALGSPGSPRPTLATERAFVLVALDRDADAQALLEANPVPEGDAAETARRDLAEATVALGRGQLDKASDLSEKAAAELDEPRALAGGSPVCALEPRFVVPASGLVARALALEARAKDRAGHPDEARRLRSRALDLAPRAPDVLAGSADAAIRRGDLADATIELEAAVGAAPDVPELEARLGSTLLARKLAADARPHLERALALGSSDPAVSFDLVRVLVATRKPDEAVEPLERARENGLDPVLYAEGRRDLARARGKVDELRVWLERLVAAHPLDVDARRELASIVAHDSPELAAREYEAVLKLAPTSEDALKAWVAAALDDLARKQGSPGEVDARLRAARARLPDDREVRALRGRFLLTQGKPEAALAELDAALDGAKRRAPEALRDRAVARIRMGTSQLQDVFREAMTPRRRCPDCGRITETVSEENYFFKLSAFERKLLEL